MVKDKNFIIEKELGIPADYQYRALRSNNFLQSNWHYNKLHILKKILSITKAQEILNLGTGSGNFELAFAKDVRKITGVDYNDEAIDFLSKQLSKFRIKNVSLLVHDIRYLSNLKTLGKFDLIVLTDILEHIKITSAQKVITSFSKFLKPNGFVCVITPNYKSPWIIIEKILDKFTLFPKFENEQHLAKYYKNNLNDIFVKKGYKSIYFRSFNLFSFVAINKSFARFLCELELKLDLPYGNLLVALFRKKLN